MAASPSMSPSASVSASVSASPSASVSASASDEAPALTQVNAINGIGYSKTGFKVPGIQLECSGRPSDITITAAHFKEIGFPRYLYGIETIPYAGANAPDAYTVTVKSSFGTTLQLTASRSTSAAEFAISNEDTIATAALLPPVTGPLTVSVSALGLAGADKGTTIILWFKQ